MQQLLQELLGTRFFAEGGPLKGRLTPGHADSRVALVAGPNASGKSFLTTMLGLWLRDEKPPVEFLSISMRMRTREGMHRCFMYGPRGDSDSTGNVSTIAVKGGLRTARERTSPCVLQFDEPDLGLAEEFGYAMGEWIGREDPTRVNEHCRGMIVVTHSRELAKGLLDQLELAPHFLHLGAPSLSLQEWMSPPVRRTLDELQGLSSVSHGRFRAIKAVLDTVDED